MDSIPLETPVVSRLRDGIKPYQPIVDGLTLLVEDGSYRHSLDNLQQLVQAGNRVIGFLSGPGGIVVLFSNGRQYLATGFAAGRITHLSRRSRRGTRVAAFARFAADATGVSTFEAWRSMLMYWPTDATEIDWHTLADDDGIADEGFHELRPYLPLDADL